MRHRGPDDEGIHLDGEIGLGHRRLSIVDIAGGHQPMTDADGALWIAFNGEIYNHLELREELEQRGCRYRTRSDTETIVHLYREYGIDALARLQGMFALAIWDRPRRRLLLARDRLGIKPLYYARAGHEFLFASEIKSLMRHGTVSREIDPLALDAYLALQYVPAPATIYSEVKKLPAGHYVRLEPDRFELRPYWSLRPGTAPASYDEGVAVFRQALQRSVTDRLMSDVPLGAFLSGGLDSSLVVALMARGMSRPVRTFTVGFGGGGWHSELAQAELMARHVGAEHHVQVVEAPDMVALLGQAAEQLDEPLADVAAIPTFLLSRFARETVKVCLSGEGADELFAGYRRYALEHSLDALSGLPRGVRAAPASLLAPLLRGRVRKAMRAAGLDQPERFVFMRSVIPAEERRALLRPELAASLPPHHLETRMAGHFETASDLNAILRADTREWLADDLLMKVDKMSMLTSLEARVPFLDHRVVELVSGFPAEWKLHRGNTKRLLKDAARGIVPEALIDRPKHGFMPPIRRWLAGEMREFVEDCLLDPQARSLQFLQPDAVRRRYLRFLAGDGRLDVSLWILLCLEVWLRHSGTENPAA